MHSHTAWCRHMCAHMPRLTCTLAHMPSCMHALAHTPSHKHLLTPQVPKCKFPPRRPAALPHTRQPRRVVSERCPNSPAVGVPCVGCVRVMLLHRSSPCITIPCMLCPGITWTLSHVTWGSQVSRTVQRLDKLCPSHPNSASHSPPRAKDKAPCHTPHPSTDLRTGAEWYLRYQHRAQPYGHLHRDQTCQQQERSLQCLHPWLLSPPKLLAGPRWEGATAPSTHPSWRGSAGHPNISQSGIRVYMGGRGDAPPARASVCSGEWDWGLKMPLSGKDPLRVGCCRQAWCQAHPNPSVPWDVGVVG